MQPGGILVFSDVHANLEATLAFIETAYMSNGEKAANSRLGKSDRIREAKRIVKERKNRYEKVILLGDLIGYGPNPNEVIDIISSIPNLEAVVGNHDEAVLKYYNSRYDFLKTRFGFDGKVNEDVLNGFAEHATETLKWTLKSLDVKSFFKLWGMFSDDGVFGKETRKSLKIGNAYFCHKGPGSFSNRYINFPKDHVNSPYELEGRESGDLGYYPWEAKDEVRHKFVFVGHSHLPHVYTLQNGKVFANPGCVGKPLEEDRQGSFYVFHPDAKKGREIHRHRIEYDAKPYLRKMRGLLSAGAITQNTFNAIAGNLEQNGKTN